VGFASYYWAWYWFWFFQFGHRNLIVYAGGINAINYVTLPLRSLTLPVVFFFIRCLLVDWSIHQSTAIAKLNDLQLTPIPPSIILREIAFTYYFRYSPIVLTSFLLGTYWGGHPVRVDRDYWISILFAAMCFIWLGVVFYGSVIQQLTRFFFWPHDIRLFSTFFRLFVLILCPLYVGFAIDHWLDAGGHFEKPFVVSTFALIIIFLVFIVGEWFMYRKVSWIQT